MTRKEITTAKKILAPHTSRQEVMGDSDGGLILTVEYTDGGQQYFADLDAARERVQEIETRQTTQPGAAPPPHRKESPMFRIRGRKPAVWTIRSKENGQFLHRAEAGQQTRFIGQPHFTNDKNFAATWRTRAEAEAALAPVSVRFDGLRLEVVEF